MISARCQVTEMEVVLYLVLSGCGWLYFLYQYLYGTGLGLVLPRYAGY